LADLFAFDFTAPAPPPPPPPALSPPVVVPGAVPAPRAEEPAAEARRVLHDGECRAAIANRRSAIVPWILMAAWARLCDERLLSPALFDELCATLATEFDMVEHRHKALIDRAWLAAGTFELPRGAYPATVRGAVAHIAWTAWRVLLPRE